MLWFQVYGIMAKIMAFFAAKLRNLNNNSQNFFFKHPQEENQNVLEQFMQYKSKDADKMNEENDKFVR